MDSTTEVVISSAGELVARLYVGTHAAKGDFEQVTTAVGALIPPVEEEVRPLLLRWFGADFAVGMSLLALSVTRGWSDSAALAAGVDEMSPAELVGALVTSTTLEAADRVKTREQVAAGLGDSARKPEVSRKLARLTHYLSRDVAHILDDPVRARAELRRLIAWAAQGYYDEQAVHEALNGRVATISDLITARGRQRAMLSLTGGWTLKDSRQRVVLLPTEALGSLVITRLLDDDRLLVAFGTLRERPQNLQARDVAEVARALSSEQRLAILRQVRQQPASGQTLAKSLGLTQATVHYHTALLRAVGLLTSTRDAHSVVHGLNEQNFRFAIDGISHAVLGDGPRDATPKH